MRNRIHLEPLPLPALSRQLPTALPLSLFNLVVALDSSRFPCRSHPFTSPLHPRRVHHRSRTFVHSFSISSLLQSSSLLRLHSNCVLVLLPQPPGPVLAGTARRTVHDNISPPPIRHRTSRSSRLVSLVNLIRRASHNLERDLVHHTLQLFKNSAACQRQPPVSAVCLLCAVARSHLEH